MDAPHAKADDSDWIVEGGAPASRRSSSDSERKARQAAWREENAAAMLSYNAWFEREGHKYLRRPQF